MCEAEMILASFRIVERMLKSWKQYKKLYEAISNYMGMELMIKIAVHFMWITEFDDIIR